jgi:hypothetical protein
MHIAQEPTREVLGPILRGVVEQVHKGPLPPITKLIRNQETTVRYIICASAPEHKTIYGGQEPRRNWVVTYRPARLHRLAESIPGLL